MIRAVDVLLAPEGTYGLVLDADPLLDACAGSGRAAQLIGDVVHDPAAGTARSVIAPVRGS